MGEQEVLSITGRKGNKARSIATISVIMVAMPDGRKRSGVYIGTKMLLLERGSSLLVVHCPELDTHSCPITNQ